MSSVLHLEDLVAPDAVIASFKATGAKQAFQEIGRRAANAYRLDCRTVTEGLLAREKLGSTAMGAGVAIPHARVPGLKFMAGVFAQLEKPVSFDTPDGQGVDLMFALLAPEQAGADHLRALARVSRLLRDEATREKLRAADDPVALYGLLTEVAASRAA